MQAKDQLSFSIKIVLLKITDKIDLGKRSYDNFSKVHYNFNINIQSDVIKSAPTN
jgi:hypothetical protein